MRRVTDPSGTKWRVDVAWTGIYLGSRFSRYRRDRARRRRDLPRRDRRSGHDAFSALDVGDLVASILDSLGGIALVVGVIVAIVALVFVFPWILVLFLDLAEILVFPIAAVAIIVWRVARHRPFVITADHGVEPILTWEVVGWREARRIERAIADAVVAGGDPEHLFPELATRR